MIAALPTAMVKTCEVLLHCIRLSLYLITSLPKNRIFISTNLNYLWAEPGVLKIITHS